MWDLEDARLSYKARARAACVGAKTAESEPDGAAAGYEAENKPFTGDKDFHSLLCGHLDGDISKTIESLPAW